jgi:hypothetical protein
MVLKRRSRSVQNLNGKSTNFLENSKENSSGEDFELFVAGND